MSTARDNDKLEVLSSFKDSNITAYNYFQFSSDEEALLNQAYAVYGNQAMRTVRSDTPACAQTIVYLLNYCNFLAQFQQRRCENNQVASIKDLQNTTDTLFDPSIKLAAEIFQLVKHESCMKKDGIIGKPLTAISLQIDEKAHALNSLMGVIKAHLEAYRDNKVVAVDSPNAKLAEYLETAYAEAQHYLDYVRNPHTSPTTWSIPASAGFWTQDFVTVPPQKQKIKSTTEPSSPMPWQEFIGRRMAGDTPPTKEHIARAAQADGANGVERNGKGRTGK